MSRLPPAQLSPDAGFVPVTPRIPVQTAHACDDLGSFQARRALDLGPVHWSDTGTFDVGGAAPTDSVQ